MSAASKDTQCPVTFAGRLNPMAIGKKSSACERQITAPSSVPGQVCKQTLDFVNKFGTVVGSSILIAALRLITEELG